MSFLDLTHWPVPKGRVYQLEATAYALLALVKAQVSKDTVALLANKDCSRAGVGNCFAWRATLGFRSR